MEVSDAAGVFIVFIMLSSHLIAENKQMDSISFQATFET